jgi:hypothetical protein
MIEGRQVDLMKILKKHYSVKREYDTKNLFPKFVLYVDNSTYRQMRSSVDELFKMYLDVGGDYFHGMRVYQVNTDDEHIEIYPVGL